MKTKYVNGHVRLDFAADDIDQIEESYRCEFLSFYGESFTAPHPDGGTYIRALFRKLHLIGRDPFE